MTENFFANLSSRTAFYIFLVLIISFLLFLLCVTPADYTSDIGDGVHHYLLAKYSYRDPGFELDLWAKPVFTMLAAPFAQFGLKGMHFMQIVCTAIIAIILFELLHTFRLKSLWLIPLLLVFTPIYFIGIYSGLTEIVFSLFLIAGIYMAVKEKWVYACILVSFLPFVRQEGYFMFPILAFSLILIKKYTHLPLLLTGIICISLYGWEAKGSLLWVFNSNPYHFDNDLYESGSIFFYTHALHELLGAPRKILFFAGFLICIYLLVKNKFYTLTAIRSNNSFFHLLFLSCTYILVFIAAESIFLAFGIFGAMGMHRLIVCIVPLIVILIMFSIDTIQSLLSKYNVKHIYTVGLSLLFIFLINIPFKQYYWPLTLKGESAVVTSACNWYKTSGIVNKKIIFSHPYTIIGLDMNPYNTSKIQEMNIVTDKTNPENSVKPGEILIWDAHFGGYDCKLPVTLFLNNPKFKVLHKELPEEPFTVLGNNPFEVYIFERL